MGEWYREWYVTSKDGEGRLRAALADTENGATNRADVQKRLDEFKQLPDDRCHISRDQRKFLERVLNG